MSEGVIVGQLREFSLQNEWQVYKPRMESFFKANKHFFKDEDLKRDTFLNALSEDAFKLLTNLAIPGNPESTTYKELIVLLDNHFSKTESVFASRFKFYNAAREQNETVNEWIARLRNLAGSCKFGNHLDKMLVDRFVIGMHKGPARDRLFEEDAEKLTIAEAIRIATNKEITDQQYRLDVKKEPVGFCKSEFSQATDSLSTFSKKKRCSVCGYTNHEVAKCRFKNYTCNKCLRIGHLAKMCPKNNGPADSRKQSSKEGKNAFCIRKSQ